MLSASADADVVVMAAAVADFRPAERHTSKIKKTPGEPSPINLTKNPDILAELGERRTAAQAGLRAQSETAADDKTQGETVAGGAVPERPPYPAVIAGFAAETDDVLANGAAKLARKGCDLLVVNQVGEHLAFGTADNAATILRADGGRAEIARGPKDDVADAVWDQVVTYF